MMVCIHALSLFLARAVSLSLSLNSSKFSATHTHTQVNDLISKSDGSHVWKGLMKYMGKDWKEVTKIKYKNKIIDSRNNDDEKSREGFFCL